MSVSLSALVDVSRSVVTPHGDVLVYPLSVGDIGWLIRHHAEAFRAIFSKDGGITTEQVLLVMPEFVASCIALGTRQRDSEPHVQKLSAGLQLSLFNAVWELTDIDATTLGKLIQRLIKTANEANQTLTTGIAN